MPPLSEGVDTIAPVESVSVKQLQDAIPAHVFERSTLKSTYYLIENITLVLITFGITYYLINYVLPPWMYWPTIVLYWAVQGTIAAGIWVLTHECGHQAYSSNKFINDAVGYLVSSAIFIPFYSFRISHALHHRYVGHLKKDTLWVPQSRSEFYGESQPVQNGNAEKKSTEAKELQEEIQDIHLSDIPILALFGQIAYMIATLLMGLPMYFLVNKTGQTYDGSWTSHFTTNNRLFNGKYLKEVWASNVGLLAAFVVFVYTVHKTSFHDVAVYYIGPYLVHNAWLVLITYLQHTDPRLAYYRDGGWKYNKAVLSTMDRSYGRILDRLHHHVGDTHIVHHFFPKLPHYNAVEATKYAKKVLGPHYNFDDAHFLKAFWRSFTQCQYVPDEGEVVYFQSDLKKK